MWEKVKLGDVATFVNGYAFKPSDWSDEGLEIIRIQNLTKSSSESNYYKGVLDSKYQITRGDILISWSATLGVYIWERPDGWLNQHIFKVVFNKIEINKPFFIYLIQHVLDDLKAQVHGATMKHITKGNFDNTLVPLPPLHIQEKIAEILDKADELRRKDKNLQSKYDELAQAIFIDMFGDPVRNEKGWDKALLKEFYKNGVKCGPFGSALKKEEFKQNGVPVWNMDNIQSFEFLDLPSLFVSEEKYISLKQYEVLNGDIIISRAGTVGKMCVVDSTFKKSLLSTNLIKLSLDDCMLKSLFFVCLMKFFSKRLGRLKTGGEEGFTHMNTGVLNNLEIYVPPIAIQEEFAKKIELINQLKAQTNAEKSEELFQSLLQKAFKGELVS